MTVDRLTEMLEETSADIAPPSLAEVAWTRALLVRRRRRVAAMVASIVAVVVTVPLGVGDRSVTPMPPARSASPVVVAPHVDGVPRSLLPAAEVPLPESWDVPANAPVLSAHPVSRAVAVAQEYDWEAPGNPMLPLHVLDTSGQWVRVDVGGLVRTRDGGGNEADPLRTASLSPDGRRVALPQPNTVVVIDLTTAEVHRIAHAVLIEQVLWIDDDTLLAEGEGAAPVRIGWRTGAVTAELAGLSLWNAVGGHVTGGEIPELISRDGRRTLRVWTAGVPGPVRETVAGEGGLPPGYHINEWYGAGVQNRTGLIAAAAWGDRPANEYGPGMSGGAEMITVIDIADGSVRRLLDLGVIGQRVKACCRVLDWIGDETLLVRTDHEGLIGWNVRTGEVRLVTAGPIPAELSVRLGR